MAAKYNYNHVITDEQIATLIAGGYIKLELPANLTITANGEEVQITLKPSPLFVTEDK